MKRWMKCLCSTVLITAIPAMTYAAITTENVDSQIMQSQTLQSQNIQDLGTQDEIWYTSPINVEPEILSPFGEVRGSYTHQGIDIRMPIGTPIYAIADATVIKAAPDSKGIDAGGGHMIMLDHKNGVQSWYMHLDAYAVSLGEEVKKGQLIGFSGCSGDSTTPLLHFEYRVNGIPLDPSFIVEASQLIDEKVVGETMIPLITLDEPFVVVQS